MNGDTPVQPASNPLQGPQPAQTPEPKEPETTWQYKTEAAPSAAPAAPIDTPAPFTPSLPADPPEASWSASEFVDHNKNINWYIGLGGITLLLDIILYFWTHDFVSIIAVTAMAALLGVMASRKPRVLNYRLDTAGLTIGSTFHPYGEFKSFALMDDGALQSITFLPLKRFMPPLSVFYAAEDQDRITQVLAQYLPMEMRQRDAIDKFSRRIRF
jgi:hypothetical protein